MRASLEDRFWAKVDKTDTCWLWTATKNQYGYGKFKLDGKARLVHRLAHEDANGPIPDGMQLDHACHVRPCVNPAHLRLATNKQNMEHRIGAQANSQSGIRGVNLHHGKWQTTVRHNGKTIYVGRFAELADAEAAAIEARNRLFTHNDLDRVSA